MKKVIVGILLLTFLPAAAQNQVRGRLTDATSGIPETGAVTQLLDGDSVRAYALTDSAGVFLLESRALKDGSYTLLVENLGRRTIRREVTLTGEPVDLGDIALEDDLQALESSKVVSARKLIKMDVDKVTYDVSEDVDAKATTVLDMLRKVPMVTVDGQDNITVNGSSSFKVYVDGKPNEMLSSNPSKVFKAMPATAVKNIEVITNPGAKYDAEGTGGVLNLVTVRNEDGTSSIPDGVNGSLYLGANSEWSVDGGLFLQARKRRFSFGLNLNSAYSDRWRGGSAESTQKTGDITLLSESGPSTQRVPFTFAQANASFEADTLNLVSASFGFDYWAYHSASPGSLSALQGDAPLYGYRSDSSQEGIYYGINTGLDYQHSFRSNKQRMLTLSYRFGINPEKGKSFSEYTDVVGTVLHPRRVLTNDRSSSHTFQADFTTPLGSEKHTLSTGLKFIYHFNKADDLYLQLDETAAEETVLSENKVDYRHYNYIAAGYAEYAGTVGKFGLKSGLRYEHTFQLAVEDGTRWPLIQYPSVVPNASVQWNFAATQNIGLAYNMRIRRPGISYLSPFINRSSTTSISYGNPDLKPSLDHSLKLEYHFFSQKVVVNAGADYRYGQGGISQYGFYGEDPDDPTVMILQNTYGNIVDSHRVGLNYFISWNPWKDTRIYSRGDGGYQTFLAKELGQSNHGWNGFLMLGAQQTIPWDIRLSANLFASSRHYSLQGWNGGFSGLSMSITKSFLDDRLNLTLQGFTNLNKGPARFRNHSEGKDFTLDGLMRFPIRSIGINLSWSFGKKGIQTTSVKRTITGDDVMSGDRGGSAASATSAAQGSGM